MAIREKNILGAISEFFVRLTTNQYIDGILTFRNDLKIRQTKKIHFVNDSDVTNATVEYDSTVNKVKINKPTQVNGADVLTINDVDSALSSSSVKPVQNNVINSVLTGKANSTHSHTIEDLDILPIILNDRDPNLETMGRGLIGEIGTICLDTNSKKMYVLTEIDSGDGSPFSLPRYIWTELINPNDMDTALDINSDNPVQNKIIKLALDGKSNRYFNNGDPNNEHPSNDVSGLEGEIGDICIDTTTNKIYILTNIYEV
mgnify:CR=1 FL=1